MMLHVQGSCLSLTYKYMYIYIDKEATWEISYQYNIYRKFQEFVDLKAAQFYTHLTNARFYHIHSGIFHCNSRQH